jgi:hypothetical protein
LIFFSKESALKASVIPVEQLVSDLIIDGMQEELSQ